MKKLRIDQNRVFSSKVQAWKSPMSPIFTGVSGYPTFGKSKENGNRLCPLYLLGFPMISAFFLPIFKKACRVVKPPSFIKMHWIDVFSPETLIPWGFQGIVSEKKVLWK